MNSFLCRALRQREVRFDLGEVIVALRRLQSLPVIDDLDAADVRAESSPVFAARSPEPMTRKFCGTAD
jgi:hypothetical protein